MGSRTPYRHIHNLGGLSEGEVVIKNQLKNLALPPGQSAKRLSKHLVNLGLVKCFIQASVAGRICLSVIGPDMSEIENQLSPSLVGGRSPDDGKQPSLKSRLPIKSCLPFHDLEINGLKDTFSIPGAAPAATDRPAVTFKMELLKLCFQCEIVHDVKCPGPTSRFHVLVVPTCESYDMNLCPGIEMRVHGLSPKSSDRMAASSCHPRTPLVAACFIDKHRH